MAETRQTKGTIECGLCHGPIAVVFVRAESNNLLLALVSQEPLRAHYDECPRLAKTPGELPAPSLPKAELSGRVRNLLGILEEAGELTRGIRACTMCGATNEACLRSLNRGKGLWGKGRRPGKACCPSCGQGNTHPSGGERSTCAEWAGEHGAQN